MNRANIATWLAPFFARPIALAGLCVLLAMVIAAIFAPSLAPYDPYAIHPMIRLTPPDGAHWFGTDQYGRDTLSRVIYSARMALLIGSGVVSFALITGIPVGVFSALFPRLGHVCVRG